jgi:3',5'-cyclic-AMP phosphodiesterase
MKSDIMPIYLPPINRRRFLAGGLAAGASLLLPWRLQAQERVVDHDYFLLASDIHIPGDHKKEYFHKSHPIESFEKARDDMFALFKQSESASQGAEQTEAASVIRCPAGLVVCGDCARHDGETHDYTTVLKLVKPLREAGMPVHLVLGNHDHREHFLETVPEAAAHAAPNTEGLGKYVSVWETKETDWLLMDSLDKTVQSPGKFGPPQLKWLEAFLDARPEKPMIIVAHHQLALPQYSEKTRSNALMDTDEFLKIVLPRKQVKAYVFGHRHCWDHGMVENLPWINIPSTAWVFTAGEPLGFVACRLKSGGASFTLHGIDHQHPKHGKKIHVAWRV